MSATSAKNARRFATLDALILVVAVAASFGLVRFWWGGDHQEWLVARFFRINPWGLPSGLAEPLFTSMLLLATPFVVAATPAVLAIRLRRPRPRWRRLAWQPGMMACLASTLGLVIAMIFTVARYTIPGGLFRCGYAAPPEENMVFITFAHAASELAGFGVFIAWATLAVDRRWRPEPGWIDRLGRLVGLAWVAMGLVAGYMVLDYSL